MNIDLFEQKSSQDASWDDLGPIWVATRGSKRAPFGTEVEPKRVTKNDAKKGLVLGSIVLSKVFAILVQSLGIVGMIILPLGSILVPLVAVDQVIQRDCWLFSDNCSANERGEALTTSQRRSA